MRTLALALFVALIGPFPALAGGDMEVWQVLPADAQEGEDLRVGKRTYWAQKVERSEWITSCRIVSQSNANDRFAISVIPKPRPQAGFLGLILKGEGFSLASGGHGAQEDQLSNVSFWAERATASLLASALDVDLEDRMHPGYALRTQFRYDATKGEAVVEITNVGPVTVLFMDGGRNRGARNNQFGFAAFKDGKPLPDTGSPLNFGGLAGYVTLEQGKTFTKAVDLSKWFDLSQEGHYDLVGTFYLEFHGSKEEHRVLWEDHVAGEFNFQIK